MATFLFAWELGAGLGHLVNLRPLAEGLSTRGHQVVLALRDLSRAKAIFRGDNIHLLQAPFKHRPTKHISPTLSFAHLLHNVGFCDPAELGGMADGWRNLYRHVEPDVIVFDHSPTALLAARSSVAKRVLLGTGFFCPLDESPLACWRPWQNPDLEKLAQDEQAVLNTINQLLDSWREPALERVSQLYHPADEHLLVTFPELDHYPARRGVPYWGAWNSGFGKAPLWPDGRGKRIYAYLKPFPSLPQLLDQFRRSGCPTIVYCDGIPPQLQIHCQSSNLRFENEPLDMSQVGRECDLAVLNANHGTAVAILLAGKPSLQIPIFLEQALLAKAIIRLGAGLGASPGDAQQITQRFEALLSDDRCSDQVRGFAAKYSNFDPDSQIDAILDRLEQLAQRQDSRPSGLGDVRSNPPDRKMQIGNWLRLAAQHESQQRLSDAATAYRLVVDADPAHFKAHYRLALVLQQNQQLEQAVSCFQKALEIRPDSPDVLNDLGCALWSLKRFEEAARVYQDVLKARPQSPAVHNNLGCVLRALGRHPEAIASYTKALAINPNVADFHNNLGCALKANAQHTAALESYRRAVAIKPDFADALSNLGTLLLEQDHFEEAIANHRQAIRIQPGNYKMHHNLGAAYCRSGRFDEAAASYDEALRLEPGVPEMQFNRGVARLSLGQLAEGWDDFECRLQSDKHVKRTFAQPSWDGSDLEGRTILLHAEQGLGDTIQFIRFLPLVRQQGAKIIVEIQPALVRIFQESQINGIIAQGDSPGPFDVQAPLMSLPKIFRTTLDAIPATVPYLRANPKLVDGWKNRLAGMSGLKVGIHWQGSRTYEGDRWRSIPLCHFAPLARMPGVHLINLQQYHGTEQIASESDRVPLIHLGADVDKTAGPFMDTAAIVQNLDLVITSDTAMAHLAGALGAQVWLCLAYVADWRWLCDREDSPWYPTIRLFRQQHFGDWPELFERLAASLVIERDRIPSNLQSLPSPDARVPQLQVANGNKSAGNSQPIARVIDPHDPQSFYRLGLKRHADGRFVEAIDCFQAALEAWPDFPQAHNDLGCALSASGNYRQALGHFRRATELKPDFADAHNNLGCALRSQHQFEAALASFQFAISLRPDFASAINNMGNVLQDQGRLDEAIASHTQALALKPENAEAHNSLGGALQRKGLFEEALKNFDEALRLKPDHIEARYSRALIWLAHGNFVAGWPDYEARQKSKRYKARRFRQPQWDGSPLKDRTILLHAEQGLGDTLQFIRYVPIVKKQAKSVVVEVQPALIPLLLQSGFKGFIGRGSQLPRFDLHAPLLSLPGILGTTVDSIPAAVPYLSADDRIVEHWRQVLSPFVGFKIGITWQGSVTYKEDRVRSIPLHYFEPLARIGGVTLFSLQKNQGMEQIAANASRFSVVDLGPDRDTSEGAFMDTAAIMKNLDLVITSDTSIAHLAGALNVPTWVCLSYVADWRWPVNRNDCPWYPGMRLFRQPYPMDWCGAFEMIVRELRAHALTMRCP